MHEVDGEDVLTAADVQKIVAQLVEAAGPAGVEEEELREQFEVAADEIRGLKISAGLYGGFAKGALRICVVDGELRWKTNDRS